MSLPSRPVPGVPEKTSRDPSPSVEREGWCQEILRLCSGMLGHLWDLGGKEP